MIKSLNLILVLIAATASSSMVFLSTYALPSGSYNRVLSSWSKHAGFNMAYEVYKGYEEANRTYPN